MKASRLVSILLLLQVRGRMTAAQLARELEVSVRTIYRDIESLHIAGVPLYADAGHSGGYRLLGGHRIRLTGLTETEVEALFLSIAPGPAAELGLGPALAAAQLKLRAAFPRELTSTAERIRSRFLLDVPGWFDEDTEVPHLRQVSEAVWRSRVLDIRYRRWNETTAAVRRVEPYGLVLKAGCWYVVAGPGPRTYRVDRILTVDVCDEQFLIPPEFNLPAYWRSTQAEFRASRARAAG